MSRYRPDTIKKDDRLHQISAFVERWMVLISDRQLSTHKIEKVRFRQKLTENADQIVSTYSTKMYYSSNYSSVYFSTFMGEIRVSSQDFSFEMKSHPIEDLEWSKIVHHISKKLLFEYYLTRDHPIPRIVLNTEFTDFLISLIPSTISDFEWKCNCGADSSQNTICSHIIGYWESIGIKFQKETNLLLKFRHTHLKDLIEAIRKNRKTYFLEFQRNFTEIESISSIPLPEVNSDFSNFWGKESKVQPNDPHSEKIDSPLDLHPNNSKISQKLKDKANENPIYIHGIEFHSFLAEIYDFFPAFRIEKIRKYVK